LFVLGGGGLFASIKKRANIIWALQVFWARKKPLFILGQSLENISGFVTRIIIAKVFNKAKMIVLRDYISRSILETIGVNKTIYVLPDPAFRIEYQSPKIHDKKKAIIVLRKSVKLTGKAFHEISKFTEWLKNEKGYEVDFVAFQDSDKSLDENTIVPQSIEEALKLLSEAKFILGMPLHSIIAAIKTQTPFISLNYAIKVDSFLRFAGLSEWGINPQNFSYEKFKEKYLELEKHHLKIEENLATLGKKANKELKDFEENFKHHSAF
jgi:polysaccharide pyruvyl transferase WcaK-like protein